MNPLLLTDLNIDKIVNSFREALTKCSKQIEADLEIATKGRVEISSTIAITKIRNEGSVTVAFAYTPVVRQHSFSSKLEDVRQMGLLA